MCFSSFNKTKGLLSAFMLIVSLLSGCAQSFEPIGRQKPSNVTAKTPTEVLGACEIFARNPGWYEELKRMEDHWGTPIHLALAFVRHESSFIHNARPIKRNAAGKKIGYKSSAYGYSQALDGTWGDFKKVVGDRVDRANFGDAAYFIGWYTSLSKKELGLSFREISEHYLAYHEGRGGYSRGRHEGKTALLAIADKVEKTALDYKKQLRSCQGKLRRMTKDKSWLFAFNY